MIGKPILLLPVGGGASRMLGLPKFMLPISDVDTLIERHCRGALSAGYEEIHIITKEKYFNFIYSYLEERSIPTHVHSLPFETTTMSETLQIGARFIPGIFDASVTIGLADTAFHGSSYFDIYSGLREVDSDFALGLFKVRPDQFGKLGQVEVNSGGKVISMKDKTFDCNYPAIWGLAKVPGSTFAELNISDAHIGITIEKLVNQGQYVSGIMNNSEYYDCGTFNEYTKYLRRVTDSL
jgi:hypothetical protein